jgi:hypothetical protein
MVFIRLNIFVICGVVEFKHAVRKDMDVNNEHQRSFVSIPLNDWSNIHNYEKRHEVLSSHIAIASQQTATHFLDIMSKKLIL